MRTTKRKPNLRSKKKGKGGVFRSLSTAERGASLSSSGSHGDGTRARDDREDPENWMKRGDRRRHLRSGEKSFYKFHSVAFPFWSWEGGSPPPLFPRTDSFPGKRFSLSVAIHSLFARSPPPFRFSLSRPIPPLSRYLAGDKRRSGI